MRLEAQARSYVCAYDRHPPQITWSRGQASMNLTECHRCAACAPCPAEAEMCAYSIRKRRVVIHAMGSRGVELRSSVATLCCRRLRAQVERPDEDQQGGQRVARPSTS